MLEYGNERRNCLAVGHPPYKKPRAAIVILFSFNGKPLSVATIGNDLGRDSHEITISMDINLENHRIQRDPILIFMITIFGLFLLAVLIEKKE